MFKNYLKIAIRNLFRHKAYSLINISGLAIGMACFMTILLYVQYELSFDTFHTKADRIFKLVEIQTYKGRSPEHVGVTQGPMDPELQADYPEVISFARLWNANSPLMTLYNDKKTRIIGTRYADPEFMRLFTFDPSVPRRIHVLIPHRTRLLIWSHRITRPSVQHTQRLDEVPTATTNNQRVSLIVGQRLKSGGEIGVAFSQNRTANNAGFRTINPVYDADMTVSFTQPLLRGRGNVNKIGMEIAEHNYKQAEIDQEGSRNELTADVRIAYWNLVLAREQLKTRRQLYDGGQRVLETIQTRVDMGAKARNSILQAELGVARREEDIIVAEDRVRDAEERLKTLMGMKDKYALRLMPTESPIGLQRQPRTLPATLDGIGKCRTQTKLPPNATHRIRA